MKKSWVFFTTIIFALLTMPVLLLAQEAGAPAGAVVVPTPPPGSEVQLGDWLKSVLDLFGGLGQYVNWQLKAVAIIFVVIGSFKVSALAPLWEKLGKGKAFVAPILGVVASLLAVWGSNVSAFSWSAAFIAISTGAGALALADLFDAVKKWPGVGPVVVSIITVLEKLLKKPQTESKPN